MERIFIKDYGGFKIKELNFIGKGMQGRVYKIDSDRCIKIFKKSKTCNEERKTLLIGQNDKHFPKLFCWGKRYIIREFIDGVELDRYLTDNELTIEMSYKIINLYESIFSIGYKRCDFALFHVFLTLDENLKIIDTARFMRKKYYYPRIMLKNLDRLGKKQTFLRHVAELKPKIISFWNKSK